jgi:hypothetical protein
MVASVVHGNRMLEGMTQVRVRSTGVRVRSSAGQCATLAMQHVHKGQLFRKEEVEE